MAQEKKPKSRAHKEGKGSGARGARKVRLTDLEKFLLTGKSTRGMKRAAAQAALFSEQATKKAETQKKRRESGLEAFRKLADR